MPLDSGAPWSRVVDHDGVTAFALVRVHSGGESLRFTHLYARIAIDL